MRQSIQTITNPQIEPPLTNPSSRGDHFTFYPCIPSILYSAHSLNLPLALASRTSAPDQAQKLLKLLHVPTPKSADPRDAEAATTAPVGGSQMMEQWIGTQAAQEAGVLDDAEEG